MLAKTGKTKMPKLDGFGNINETELIEKWAVHALGQYTSDTEVERQYRLMSGFVHNCAWAPRTGQKMRTEIGKDRAERQLTGNSKNIYNGAVGAFAREARQGPVARASGNVSVCCAWCWKSGSVYPTAKVPPPSVGMG